MSKYIKILLLLLMPVFVNAQLQKLPDSSLQPLQIASADSVRYLLYHELSHNSINNDSALFYIERCLSLSRKHHKKLNEAEDLSDKAYFLTDAGQYAASLENFLKAFEIAENFESEKHFWTLKSYPSPRKFRLYLLANTHFNFGHLMGRTENKNKQIFHYRMAKKIAERNGDVTNFTFANAGLGMVYYEKNQFDSALFFINTAINNTKESEDRFYSSIYYMIQGNVHLKMNDGALAYQSFRKGIQSATENHYYEGLIVNYFGLSQYFRAESDIDSSLFYAIRSMEGFKAVKQIAGSDNNIGTAYQNLSEVYQSKNQRDSAFKYLRLAMATKDSLSKEKIKNLAQFEAKLLSEQLRLKELEKEKAITQGRIKTYSLLAGLGVFLLISLFLYRANQSKQKAKAKIEKAYEELKATQTQLIQREKMASLGELTAGIAHEIQNPLNFVNNFSEVSQELMTELKEEAVAGNQQEVLAIADDITQNLSKIHHHGQRADSIVKGMLQHSRATTGEKQPTDLNALVEEYLRLCYHGLKAKDKDFNANLVTDFDAQVGTVVVVPQEIGRVLLNLFNNAFYATQQNKHLLNGQYQPEVKISTGKIRDKVEIRVIDNGVGIPQAVQQKIFQPFFTTKPTGQGTGLGLSLSYDIITKGHGGELKVESQPGEGAEFTVVLPI